ncbi:FYN-binding protein 1-like isoform X1 [Littorina saxatilis]|uniref:SH3 domain-containing protein n=1 Tax=Littorina saxatilis TaxID=31220 RepID=A0AAN9B831_9CAEN
MAGDGLSVKERLALLQNNNNKNPNLAGCIKNPPPGAAPTAAPGTKPKPDAKPAPTFPALKHVNKPNSPNKYGSAVLAKPSTPLKPPATPPKGGSDSVNGQENASAFPKLRPAGGGGGGGGGKGITPLVPKKPLGSTSTESSGNSVGVVAMRDKGDSNGNSSPPRPLSIQERMAALKKKADEGSDSSSKENSGSVTSPTKPPISPVTKSPLLPSKPSSTTASVASRFNGSVTTGQSGSGTTAPVGPLKPSDIIKSINKAADNKVADRNKAPGSGTAAARKSSELYQRNSDGKKFRKVEVATVISTFPAPPKPDKIDNVDLTSFLKAYAAAKEAKIKVDAAKGGQADSVDGDVEELYVEAESESVPVATRSSVNRAHSVRISKIPELTEEEEKQELYTDGSSAPPGGIPPDPEEMYDDCESAQQGAGAKQVEEDPDEIYEPLDELDVPESDQSPSPVPSPKIPDNNKKAKKEKDKEKDKEKEKGKKKDKGKDETNKKEEKERKKKEEDLKKLRAKFGLSEGDEKVGDGVVKTNAGGGLGVFSKDLQVTKGEIIAILRMDGNPAGKWLAQTEAGKIGYVNSNNIEVATPTIKHSFSTMRPMSMKPKAALLMGGVKAEFPNEEDPEEMYEPLPDEGEMDEIYEEV